MLLAKRADPLLKPRDLFDAGADDDQVLQRFVFVVLVLVGGVQQGILVLEVLHSVLAATPCCATAATSALPVILELIVVRGGILVKGRGRNRLLGRWATMFFLVLFRLLLAAWVVDGLIVAAELRLRGATSREYSVAALQRVAFIDHNAAIEPMLLSLNGLFKHGAYRSVISLARSRAADFSRLLPLRFATALIRPRRMKKKLGSQLAVVHLLDLALLELLDELLADGHLTGQAFEAARHTFFNDFLVQGAVVSPLFLLFTCIAFYKGAQMQLISLDNALKFLLDSLMPVCSFFCGGRRIT